MGPNLQFTGTPSQRKYLKSHFMIGDDVLGILIRDKIDKDFVAVVMTRDEIGRFRAVDIAHSLPTLDDAAIICTPQRAQPRRSR
jgi:hypothetical protein